MAYILIAKFARKNYDFNWNLLDPFIYLANFYVVSYSIDNKGILLKTREQSENDIQKPGIATTIPNITSTKKTTIWGEKL